MDKNVRKIFFIATFLILIMCVTSISATDVSNNTDTSSSVEDNQGINEVSTLDTNIAENTHTKNIKTEEHTTDLYVSDTDGSDDNNGTNISPYKTIEKALNKTTNTGIYNIHILPGTYKGLGNTNLTVNGNNTINLIGTGMNNTILHGEATYRITGDGGVWSSSEVWSPYVDDSGNYAMSITEGSGQITLTNMTITQMWCPGGDSIYLYEHSPVDNYGNLIIDNVEFYYNHGGVGSAVRNNEKATILINNTIFEQNRKSSSTGNDGIFYNIGNATVLNSIFNNNYARWGSILNDKNIIVINTTFSNNIGYDGSSTYKYGPGFVYNSGGTDYFNPGNHATNNTVINCTFINNDQTDIYGYSGPITATNNQFINSTGIRLVGGTNCKVINNTLTGIKSSSITYSMTTGSSTCAIYSSSSRNISIENNTIEMNNGIGIYSMGANITNNNISIKNNTGTSIIVSDTNNTNITYNNLNQMMNITGNNVTIKNNNITTSNDYTIALISNPRNVTITDNYLKARFYQGDYSVRNPRNNIVENNTPKISENIYVKNTVKTPANGTMKNPTTLVDAISKVKNNESIILINGEYNLTDTLVISDETTLTDTKTFNIIGLNDAVSNDVENTVINGQKNQILKILTGYDIRIENITFTDAQSSNGGAIYTESNLTIENSKFIDNNATNGAAIYAIGDINININNNEFTNNIADTETIYLKQITTKNITNNKYQNNSIQTTTMIELDEDIPELHTNQEININIKKIELTNPENYDADITQSPVNVYINGELTTTLIDGTSTYAISSSNPTSMTTYVQPEFTNIKSNTLILELDLETLNTNIIAPPVLVFGGNKAELKIKVLDAYDSPVSKGTVTVYENDVKITTLNLTDGKATYTTETLETLETKDILLVYEDDTDTYTKTNTTTQIAVTDAIYVSPETTTASLGSNNNPTTITDALTKIQENQTIILLNGTISMTKPIIINNNTTNAKRFTITGKDHAIIDGQNITKLLDIDKNYNIEINNVTFTQANSTEGAIVINQSNITINNCKVTDNNYILQAWPYDIDPSSGITASNSTITINNTLFDNNRGEWGGAMKLIYSNATITNSTFTNLYAQVGGAVCLANSTLIVNNTNFENTTNNIEGTIIAAYTMSDFNLTIENCTISNIQSNHTNNKGLIRPYSGYLYEPKYNTIITNSRFINISLPDANTAIICCGKDVAIFTNNYCENITAVTNTASVGHVGFFANETTVISENNTFKNCTIGLVYNITLDNTTIYQVGDEVEINVNLINLTSPNAYIGTLKSDDAESINQYMDDLNEFMTLVNEELTYDVYLNDEYIKTTSNGIDTFKITTNVPNISTLYVINSNGQKSNTISFESELNGLKNTIINIDVPYSYINNTIINVEVTDRTDTPATTGIVTLYEDSLVIGQSEIENGVCMITINNITFGSHSITVHYNDTVKYNNQSINYIINTLMSKLYVGSNVTEPGLGTIENPTTLTDALTRIGNNGTIYFLPGVHEFNETILIGTLGKQYAYPKYTGWGTMDPSVKYISLEGINDSIITSTSIITIYNGIHTNISNLKFINNNQGVSLICGNYITNCSFINGRRAIYVDNGLHETNIINCIFKNHNESAIGGKGNPHIYNSVFINNTSIQKGGAISLAETEGAPYTVTSINNTYIGNYAKNYGGAISSAGAISINDTFINNTSPTGGSIYVKHHHDIAELQVYNGKFINSTATYGGAIYTQVRKVSIKNSLFKNITARSETNYISLETNKTIENNTYNNCSMTFKEFTLKSPQNNTNISDNSNISLNLEISLLHPSFYDVDILQRTGYPLLINEKHRYNITNNITIPAEYDTEQGGVLNIYASMLDKKTNYITIKVLKSEIVVDPITTSLGDTINITARIIAGTETMTNINAGKVTFKVNGKTVKDANGKVIYAKVVNGTATIADYLVSDTWNENTTIQAIYSGSSQYEKLTSEKTTITIKQSTPTVPTLSTSNITASAGSTITLTATITDGAKQINNGKIVFKINGKTIKDANGKVIYAKVVNGQVSVEYTLPIDMKTKEYNLTATYISNDYHLEDNKILTVKK